MPYFLKIAKERLAGQGTEWMDFGTCLDSANQNTTGRLLILTGRSDSLSTKTLQAQAILNLVCSSAPSSTMAITVWLLFCYYAGLSPPDSLLVHFWTKVKELQLTFEDIEGYLKTARLQAYTQ